MRELTDRELDAVCGGLVISAFNQSIWNYQSNKARVWQSASAWGGSATNSSTVTQSNNANNTNTQTNNF
jgi:hypothetical protein